MPVEGEGWPNASGRCGLSGLVEFQKSGDLAQFPQFSPGPDMNGPTVTEAASAGRGRAKQPENELHPGPNRPPGDLRSALGPSLLAAPGDSRMGTIYFQVSTLASTFRILPG